MKLSVNHSIEHRVFGLVQLSSQRINMTAIVVPGGCTSCSPSSSSSCGAVSTNK